jgi:hypothetical protein
MYAGLLTLEQKSKNVSFFLKIKKRKEYQNFYKRLSHVCKNYRQSQLLFRPEFLSKI